MIGTLGKPVRRSLADLSALLACFPFPFIRQFCDPNFRAAQSGATISTILDSFKRLWIAREKVLGNAGLVTPILSKYLRIKGLLWL